MIVDRDFTPDGTAIRNNVLAPGLQQALDRRLSEPEAERHRSAYQEIRDSLGHDQAGFLDDVRFVHPGAQVVIHAERHRSPYGVTVLDE